MRRGWLLAWLLFTAWTAHALTLPVENAIRPTALAPYTTYLCDPGGTLTLADIRQRPLQPLGRKEISFGFRQPPCWFHVRLSNTGNAQAERILSADFNIIDRIDLYRTDPNGRVLAHLRNGDTVPWTERALQTRMLAFPVSIAAGTTDLYLRVETNSTLFLPLKLSTLPEYLQLTALTEVIIGLVYGIAIGLLLYHLVLWLLNRNRTQAWYLSYVFFTLCFFAMEQGSLFPLWPMATGWNNAFLYSASFLMLATALMFSRSYLSTADRPRLHRLVTGLAFAYTLLALLHPLADTAFIAPLNAACGLLTILGVMALGLWRWRQGQAQARLFLLSWGLLLIVGVIFIAMLNLGVPGISSVILAAQAAFAAQQILLSVGLAERVKTLEAESAAREQESRLARAESAAKSEFLARMSHEIRTPLNAILGVSQLLEDSGAHAAQQEKLGILRHSGEQLLSIINDILDYSKVVSGKLALEKITFHLPSLLEDTARLFTLEAARKQLEFRYTAHPDLPEWIHDDPTRLRQILFNLLGNAVKFTESGHIGLRTECFALPDEEGILCRFLVEDTGIGMSREQVVGLFNSFHQADVSISRRYGGTGLGLAISRQLAGLMQATLEVKSEPGRGSLFVLNVTLHPTAPPADAPASGQASPVAGDRRILVCEDNAVNQTIITAMLDRLGYHRYRVIANGRDALDELTARHDHWDLVLMDCEMPEMDGLTAVRELRAWELQQAQPRLPVIALTAHVMPEYRQRCRDAGMDGYLAKPVLLAELDRQLRAAFA